MANGSDKLSESFGFASCVIFFSHIKFSKTCNYIVKVLLSQVVLFHDVINEGSELNFRIGFLDIVWFGRAWFLLVGKWINWFVWFERVWFLLVVKWIDWFWFDNFDWYSKNTSELYQVVIFVKVNQLIHFVDFIPNLLGLDGMKCDNDWLFRLKAFYFNQILRT